MITTLCTQRTNNYCVCRFPSPKHLFPTSAAAAAAMAGQ